MKPHFLLALLAISFQFSNPCSNENQNQELSLKAETPMVEVTKAQVIQKPQTLLLKGQIEYTQSADIRAQLSGVIEKIYVAPGDNVQPQDPLFQLSLTSLQDQIDLKNAQLKEYQARLLVAQTRIENQGQTEAPTTTEDIEFLDEEPKEEPAQKNFENAPEEVPATQRALALVLQSLVDKLTLEIENLEKQKNTLLHVSPIAGVVTEQIFQLGNPVEFQDIVMNVAQTEPLSVSFQMPEDQAHFVNKQSKVQIDLSLSQTVASEGLVYFIAPYLDESTKTFLMKAHVSNPLGLLKQGESIDLTIHTNKMEKVFSVPLSSVVSADNKHFVFIVAGQRARWIEAFNLVTQDNDTVSVTGDFNINDLIVLNPPETLKNGDFVKVQNPADAL